MKIQRLAVENFKSFDRLDLELGAFNVFIGANASGKSNVLHILEFLRDIAASGLRNAVSMQGGMEFLRNVKVGAAKTTIVETKFSPRERYSAPIINAEAEKRGKTVWVESIVKEAEYLLSLQHNASAKGFSTATDELNITFFATGNGEEKNAGDILYTFSKKENKIQVKAESKNDRISPLVPMLSDEEKEMKPSESLLERSGTISHFSAGQDLEGLFLYDFDTKAQRKAAPIKGKAELNEDGSNVALVLRNLLDDKEQRRRFTNLIQYVLPFVSDVDVEHFATRSLIATLEETHTPGTYLPASLLSEGTIKVISLLIALYFEEKPVIAFEEPASNLHPKLISRVVEMMKEQSKEKQIFVTTHSPEVIKHAGLENVYLVSRDENGFSTVTKPAEKEEVRIFLENEMGIDDLFVQGLLDI